MDAPIAIEKGVPVPVVSSRQKYPFNEMEVGDSFTVPLSGILKGALDSNAQRLHSAAYSAGKALGRKFTVRSIAVEGVARCWRFS